MEDRSSAPKQTHSSPRSSTPDTNKASASRPLYSSKLGDPKGRAPAESSSSPTTRQPPVQQKAWTSAKNPITGRTQPAPNNFTAQDKTALLREGQRVRFTFANGAEYEGIYANHPSDPGSCYLRMVQQKKNNSGQFMNGTSRREQPNMSFPRKDITEAHVISGNAGKADSKPLNGNRASFRTDKAISNSGPGAERVLQRWNPDGAGDIDGGLEQTKSTGAKWDQFAANEQLFGVKTDYDENIYTTTIDKAHPQYKERMAAAERKAREIEGSAPTTAHVAEERVMDFAGGDDTRDEEEKYSGVRRQDFPPLSGRENKYTPPARRAPTAQATVKGAPFDPAIISSQLKSAAPKQSAVNTEDSKPQTQPAKSPATPTGENTSTDTKSGAKKDGKGDSKAADAKAGDAKAADAKNSDKTSLRPSANNSRTISPQGKDGAAPSATETVERDVLNSFKTFATQQRQNAAAARSHKIKADNQIKLIELKRFADSFKLSTPVPSDLISIIAKDPHKQKQIQEKALQNAEIMARQKAIATAETKDKEKETTPTAKETQRKPAPEPTTAPANTPADTRSNSRPTAPQHASSPAGVPNRHAGSRSSYNPQQNHYGYGRNNRAPHMAPQAQTGTLAQRLRENQKMHPPQQHSHVGQHMAGQDMRVPPSGPASVDPGFGRRLSGLPPQPHLAPKLNPNSHEFRPNAFAPAFNPTGPSQGSSPRSSVNHVVVEPQPTSAPTGGQLIRRKTKAIDVKKCFILSHIETIRPPQGRNWEENDSLRPAFDTMPTWRQLQEETEKPDSTMNMTYKEYFEKYPFSGAALATPNTAHVVPLPHHHQIPYHLQHGPQQHLGPRASPHIPPMQMHTAQHMPVHHGSFNGPDDHRMMHSNSAQSYSSPRLGAVPMAYPPHMQVPAQMYGGQPMQPFMPSTPQMNQYRSFSNNQQFMPQQPPQMGGAPVMVQPQFVAPGPNGMMPPGPQVQMYPAAGHAQFMPPGAGPPQQMGGANGFPSPGRQAAPMMVHQGSHQGQPGVYGMSPAMPYQQPAYPQQSQGKFSGPRPQ